MAEIKSSLKLVRFADSEDFNAQDSFNDWNENNPNIEIIDIKVVNVSSDVDCIYLFYREIKPKPLSRVQMDLIDSFYGYDCPCS